MNRSIFTLLMIAGVAFVIFSSSISEPVPKTAKPETNNPGNIRDVPGQTWRGQIGVSDSGFVIFSDPTYGIRAMGIILDNYRDLYDLRTIREMITRWAPPAENPTESYITFVSNMTGIPADRRITFFTWWRDKNKIVKAMIEFESGMRNQYSDNYIRNALSLPV